MVAGRRCLNVCGYEYKGILLPSWTRVQSYFRFNMDMLDTQTCANDLFSGASPYTPRYATRCPPDYGDKVVCGQLAGGGRLRDRRHGGKLLCSSAACASRQDAHVKNCIIMQDGQVHSGRRTVENCILDKQAVIKRNARLIGPAAYPIVIAKNVVI